MVEVVGKEDKRKLRSLSIDDKRKGNSALGPFGGEAGKKRAASDGWMVRFWNGGL